MASAFEEFVNDNLPPKISIDVIPPSGNADAGKIPVFTGVGLQVEQANLESAADSVRVGKSAVAQFATVQEAMTYARSHLEINEIIIEPGIYAETGYLNVDRNIVFSAANPLDKPSLRFSDTSKAIYINGAAISFKLNNIRFINFGVAANFSSVVVGGAIGTGTPSLNLDGSGISIASFAPGTFSLRSVTQEDTQARDFQINMYNESYLTIIGINVIDPSGVVKGVELKYPASQSSSSGASVLEMKNGSYIHISTKRSAIGVEWDWLDSVDISDSEFWIHPGNDAFPSDYTFIKTNCYNIKLNSTNSKYLNYSVGSSPSGNPQTVTIFDCPTTNTSAYILSKNNLFFDKYPGSVENNIFKNLQNSITAKSILDTATPNFTISRNGDTTEVVTYSVLENAGKLSMSDGVSYIPANSSHWSGDPFNLTDAVDRIAAVVYTLRGNIPIP